MRLVTGDCVHGLLQKAVAFADSRCFCSLGKACGPHCSLGLFRIRDRGCLQVLGGVIRLMI